MRTAIVVAALAACSLFSLPARDARADEAPNACGCYRDDAGTCRCRRPSKCGCPGDCEPANCEAKRQAEAERENRAAMKRIAERERKAAAEAKKQAKRGGKPVKKPAAEETAAPDAVDREVNDLLGTDKAGKKR